MKVGIFVFSVFYLIFVYFIVELMKTRYKPAKTYSEIVDGENYTVYSNYFYKTYLTYVFLPLGIFFLYLAYEEFLVRQSIGPHHSIFLFIFMLLAGIFILYFWAWWCFVKVYCSESKGLIIRTINQELRLGWNEIKGIKKIHGKADDCYALKTVSNGTVHIIASIDHVGKLAKSIRSRMKK